MKSCSATASTRSPRIPARRAARPASGSGTSCVSDSPRPARMAVYTEVDFDDAAALVASVGLGALHKLSPCAGGIENTNYFVDTAAGRFVLTVFERLRADELPFYLQLMKHHADHALPVPRPHAAADGSLVLAFAGKPAAIVDRLPGEHHLAPDGDDCASVGAVLARLHLSARDFAPAQPNLRGLAWWNETVPVVVPHLDVGAGRADERRARLPAPPRRVVGVRDPAARRDPRRPLPRQRHVRRAEPRRRVRLLLRRRRHAAVRHRRRPQRLVHRPRARAASTRTVPMPSSPPTRRCGRSRPPR